MASLHHQLSPNNNFSEIEKIAVLYHSIFRYPLKKGELVHWKVGKIMKLSKNVEIKSSKEFLFTKGQLKFISKRQQNELSSRKKWRLVKIAEKVLKRIPTIKLVAITGSLAMNNASSTSDIDMLVVTRANSMWTTRLLTLFVLRLSGFSLRKSGVKNEKDKLCLNMWLDERDLKLTNKNIFIAHELVQIVPVINKDKTYERLISENEWIFDYWPKAVINMHYVESKKKKAKFLLQIVERFAYLIQYLYMKKKITNETITPLRAFFHPRDWSIEVLEELKKRGVA